MKYFANLPVISYANNYVRNILTRVKMMDQFRDNTAAFYPFILNESSPSGVRLENLAYDYYDDVDDVWIIHLTNDIIDPYYDTYLNTENFDKFITKKYGSVRNANRKILFYRNNYDQDDRVISEETYNQLSGKVKKYWSPSVNFDGKIIGYQRLADDTTISTNMILTVEIELNSNTTFSKDERVVQQTTGAEGFITFSNTSILTLQHITGSFSANYNIVGDSSSANASVTSVKLITAGNDESIVQTLDENEVVYFSPVTAYDYENELNELKKNVSLLDSRFKSTVYSNFYELMNEDTNG